MPNSSSTARKAAYLFLTLCCGALLALGGFRVYDIYGPSKIVVGGIPYGLPAGSTVIRGDTPDLAAEMAAVPVQVQTELRRAAELARSGSLQSAYDIYDGVVVLYPDLLPALLGQLNILFEMDSLSDAQQDRLFLLINSRCAIPVLEWQPIWKAVKFTSPVTKRLPWNWRESLRNALRPFTRLVCGMANS